MNSSRDKKKGAYRSGGEVLINSDPGPELRTSRKGEGESKSANKIHDMSEKEKACFKLTKCS